MQTCTFNRSGQLKENIFSSCCILHALNDRKTETDNKKLGWQQQNEIGTLMQVFPTRSFSSQILVKTWFQTFSTAWRKHIILLEVSTINNTKKSKSCHFQMTSLKYVKFLSNTASVYGVLNVTPTFHWGTQSSDWFHIIQKTVKLLTLDFPRRGFPTLHVTVAVPLSGSLFSHSTGWTTRTSVV